MQAETGYILVDTKTRAKTVNGIEIATVQDDRKGMANKGYALADTVEYKKGTTIWFDRGSAWLVEQDIYAVKVTGILCTDAQSAE